MSAQNALFRGFDHRQFGKRLLRGRFNLSLHKVLTPFFVLSSMRRIELNLFHALGSSPPTCEDGFQTVLMAVRHLLAVGA